MDKNKIHIVMIETGEYSDRREQPYKAFFDKEKAKECVDKISEELRVLVEKYNDRIRMFKEYRDVPADPELTPLLYSLGFCLQSYEADAFLYEDVEIADEEV